MRGGIVERSMTIFCRDALEVGRDDCGELSEDMVKVVWYFLSVCKAVDNYQKMATRLFLCPAGKVATVGPLKG
jgi:hypothetical protein